MFVRTHISECIVAFLTDVHDDLVILTRSLSLWFVRSGIFHCYWEFASLKGVAGADVTIKDLGLQTDFSIYLQIRQTWLAFSEPTLSPRQLTLSPNTTLIKPYFTPSHPTPP